MDKDNTLEVDKLVSELQKVSDNYNATVVLNSEVCQSMYISREIVNSVKEATKNILDKENLDVKNICEFREEISKRVEVIEDAISKINKGILANSMNLRKNSDCVQLNVANSDYVQHNAANSDCVKLKAANSIPEIEQLLNHLNHPNLVVNDVAELRKNVDIIVKWLNDETNKITVANPLNLVTKKDCVHEHLHPLKVDKFMMLLSDARFYHLKARMRDAKVRNASIWYEKGDAIRTALENIEKMELNVTVSNLRELRRKMIDTSRMIINEANKIFATIPRKPNDSLLELVPPRIRIVPRRRY